MTSEHCQRIDDVTICRHLAVEYTFLYSIHPGHYGLLLKLKSIGVGGSVQSICTECRSDRRQGVVVDGAASDWIPIISGVAQGSVLCPFLFNLFTNEMFVLVDY